MPLTAGPPSASASWATVGLPPPNWDSPSAPGELSPPPRVQGGACPARLCRGSAGAARRVDRQTASCCLLCRVPTATPHTHHSAGCFPWATAPSCDTPLPIPQTPQPPSPLPHPSPALLPAPSSRPDPPSLQRGHGHPQLSRGLATPKHHTRLCPATDLSCLRCLPGTGATVTALGCAWGQAVGPSALGTPISRWSVCHHPQSSVPVPDPGTLWEGGQCPCSAATSPSQHP